MLESNSQNAIDIVEQFEKFDHGKNNSTNIATCVLDHRRKALTEEVASSVALTNGVSALKSNRNELDQLIEHMIDAKVLPNGEVELGYESKASHLSMRKKISEYADVILDPEISPYLHASYSVLYQFAMLAEETNRDVPKLRKIAAASDGPLTRRYIKEWREPYRPSQRKLASRKEGREASLTSPQPEGSREAQQDSTAIGAETHPQDHSSGGKSPGRDASAEVSALLLTPSKPDIAKLYDDWLEDDAPPCMQFATAKDAVLAAVVRAVDAPAVARNLESWGFSRVSRVYLPQPMSGPELTQAEVVVVAERGAARHTPLKSWHENLSSVDYAKMTLEGVEGMRVHLFARNDDPQWDCVIGAANWPPTLKAAA